MTEQLFGAINLFFSFNEQLFGTKGTTVQIQTERTNRVYIIYLFCSLVRFLFHGGMKGVKNQSQYIHPTISKLRCLTLCAVLCVMPGLDTSCSLCPLRG